MGKNSAIPWTDHTFNPWHGCQKIGGRRACSNCYAEAFAKRTGHNIWGASQPRRFFGEKHWTEPLKWNKAAIGAARKPRVFCMSMGDLFENRSDLVEPRSRAFSLMHQTPHLEWLLLTKRIRNVVGMVDATPWRWPHNARLGITIGTQEDAWEDLPVLADVCAANKWSNFVSIEPCLEAIDLGPTVDHLDWAICGCESRGSRLGRPLQLDWVRSLRDQCQAAGTPFFYKQGPVDGKLVELPELDGRVWAEVPGAK